MILARNPHGGADGLFRSGISAEYRKFVVYARGSYYGLLSRALMRLPTARRVFVTASEVLCKAAVSAGTMSRGIVPKNSVA